MIEVYVANLAKYNEGKLVGEWITLPCLNLQERIASVLGTDEEYAIHDYETTIKKFEINEYDNLNELNELAEKLQDVDIEIFEAIMEATGDDIYQSLITYDRGDYCTLKNIENETDLGYAIVEEGLFGYDIPDNLKYFINYKLIGEEAVRCDFTICKNGIAIEFF